MMWLVFLFVSLSLIAPTDVLAEQRYLSGQVLHKQDTGRDKPIKGAVISIVKVGNPYATGEDGVYRVVVPDAIQPGETIKLHVKKIGWEIDKPEGGKFELPRDLAKDVFVLPESSSEFLSDHHIDEFLESLPELTKAQIKPDEHREDVDPTLPVKEYATQHGLSYEATLSAVQKRVRFYEERGNPNQQCLAAVYRKDFERISTLCKPKRTDKIQELGKKRQEFEKLSKGGVSSLEKKDHRFRILALGTTSVAPRRLILGSETPRSKQSKLYETKRELVQLIEEVVGDFRTAGDAYYINYEFTKALQTYQQGLEYVAKDEVPTLWADLQILIGNANSEMAIRSEGPAIHEHRKAALKAYQQSLLVYTRDQFPQAWAGVQNNLGNTLGDQGIRTGGEEGRQLLAQAVAAYKAALEVYTREHLPEGWAQTHSNLAEAYLSLEDWQRAAESYRNVLTLYPDSAKTYFAACSLYQEKLFAYSEAFELTKHWLQQHPDDIAAQANFAEAHFTTGRFDEAEQRLATLPTNDALRDNAVPLRALQIATLYTLNKRSLISERMTALRKLIAGQAKDFKVEWSFEGTKHFISNDKRLTASRDWLLRLFTAFEGKDRDAILVALGEVESGLQTSSTR